MPSDERFLEWTYPVAGIDRQEEFQEQPALTTAVAKNVRAFESLSDRGRGGSRPGLSKYLADTVPSGAHLIQHLKVIVDPQGPLTGLSFGPNDTTTNDTSDGGRAVLDTGETRLIRVGGSGFYTHPETDQTPDSGETSIEKVQSKANFFTQGSVAREITFDSDVENQSVVIVIVGQLTSGGSGSGVSVTNDAGDAYTRVGVGGADDGYAISVDDVNAEYRCSIWWKQVSGGSADDKVVRVTPTANTFITIYAAEFRNVATSLAVRDYAIAAESVPADGSTVPSPTNVSVDYTTKDLVVRVFKEVGSGLTGSYSMSGYGGTYATFATNPGGTFQGSTGFSVDATAPTESFTLTHPDPGSDPDRLGFVFIAAGFKWSGA